MPHYFTSIKRKYTGLRRAVKKIILRADTAGGGKAVIISTIIVLIFLILVAVGGMYDCRIQGRKIKPAAIPAQPSVIEIRGVNIALDANPVKIEWNTSKQAESRLLLFKAGSGSGQVFTSLYGFCTSHTVEIEMESNTDYFYEIEAVSGGHVITSKKGAFRTPFFPSE